MFEQKFKALILKFLGEFVEEFDDSSLRVDNWTGQVTQTRLSLRPGSLRFLSMILGIDIKVVRGMIGTLQISFNWRALWKEPIKLTLEDLYIVCKASDTPDSSIFLASRRKKKREKVEDKQLKTKLNNPNKNYFQQLESTIIDNLCVSVKNVHIRYEDTTSNQYKPFVIGLTLEKLNYSPSDSNWKKSFVTLEAKKQANKSFMLLELAQFSIYHVSKCTDLFTTKIDWLQSISNDKFASVMYQFIAHRDTVTLISEYYLLKPVNAEIRIRRSLKSPLESEIPKLSVSILVEEMACALDNNQYQDLLMLGSVISLHKAVGVFINLRPLQRPKYKTRDWWIYILSRIRQKISRRLYPKTREYLAFRKKNKTEYVNIYKHMLVKEYESEYNRSIAKFLKIPVLATLSEKDLENKMLVIEDSHNVEEIYLFRCIAERELSAIKEQKKGWLEWGRGWFVSNSAEEENFLKSLVEYSELISNDQNVTTKYTKSFIYFFLNKCSISLDSRHTSGSRVSLLKLSLYQATVHRTITPSLTKIFAALTSLKIIDPFTPIEKFRKLFTPKGVDESYFEGNPSFEIEEEIFPEENDGFPEFACIDTKQEPLFRLEFNSSEVEEMSLRATLKPLEIVYNRYCIERITGFFKVPEALALYESIEIQTMNQLSKLKSKTHARLDLLMKNRMNIDIDITVSAPLIIVPENTLNEDTSLILLNTGDLRIISRPRKYNLSLLANRKNSDIDDNTYYDDFEIQITDINVALMPAETSISENIIEKFNIRMQVSKSVIPKDPYLTTLKVSGEIQELTAKISKLQYMTLRQYSGQSEQKIVEEPEVEYKPPVIIEDPDDEEFFDLPDQYEAVVTENIKFPYEKEHFRADFSIKSVGLVIVDDTEEKQLLTFAAKELMLGYSNQEAKNIFALKLGYICVHDWVEKRDIVNSNSEASDLINIELTKYLENHPEYTIQEFHQHFWMVISDLHINYYEGNNYLELFRFAMNTIQIPSSARIKVNTNFDAKINLTNVSCKLTDHGKDITELHLASSEINLNSCDYFGCVLGELTVRDFTQNILFFETLNSQLLELKIKNEENGKNFFCSMNSFKIILGTNMILTLYELYQHSTIKKLISLKNSSPKNDFSTVFIKVDKPIFELLSTNSSCDIDMGVLEFYKNLEIYELSMQDSSIFTLIQHDGEVYKDHLISDFCLKIHAEFPKVNCSIPSISISTSMAQLKFLKKILKDYQEKLLKFNFYPKEKEPSLSQPYENNFSIENLIYGQNEESEQLNLTITLETGSFSWLIDLQELDHIKVNYILEINLENLNLSFIKMSSHQWLKVELSRIQVGWKNQENFKVFLPQNDRVLSVNTQILPEKFIVDIILNPAKIIITPLTLKIAKGLIDELSGMVPVNNKKRAEVLVNGEFSGLKIVLTTDTVIMQDEEHVEYTENEYKRFCMVQLTGEFQGTNVKCDEFFVTLGKSSKYEESIGKNFIHPMKFEVIFLDSLEITCSEINVDFSISQIHFFKGIFDNFFQGNSAKSNISTKKLPINLKIQQVLLSVSHDSSLLASSNTSTYFIVQLNLPNLFFHNKISFTTQLAIFYFNQQHMSWEPLIEKSSLALKYCFKEKPKKFECESSDAFNINISSAFISCFCNFWTGIEDYNLLDVSTPTLKMINRIQSGFTIRNETGQRIRYCVDKRTFTLLNLEENSLEFEEIEEEQQLAPVIMFKNNMKARKAYKAKKVTIKLAERLEISDICIDKLGSKVYNLSYKGANYQVICEVTSRHGNNLLTIKSPVYLKNSLKEPIDIRLIFSFASQSRNESQYSNNIPLAPMSQVPLPIDFLGFTEFQLKIKGYSWSHQKSINVQEPTIIECQQVSLNSYEKSNFKDKEMHKVASAVLKVYFDELKDDNDKFFARIFNFESPFIIENSLCCDLEYFCRVEGSDVRPKGLLMRGEQFNCLEIHPSSVVSLALRIPGYEVTSFLTIEKEIKQIFQFSKKHSEQVNVVLEASVKEGMFKVVLFAEYWLENHTGMPLLFKYMENNQDYDVISLPYVVEGLHIDGHNLKKSKAFAGSMFSIFGQKFEIEDDPVKPWMKYSETKKLGLSSLLDDEEDQEDGQGTVRMFSSDSTALQKSQVAIKLANSHWSKSFRLVTSKSKKDLLASSEQSIKALENCSSKRKCMYEVAMTISIAEKPFERTKVIRFIPRFVMINKMPCCLLVSQYLPDDDYNGACRLVSGERSAFHWPNHQTGRSVCIRIDQYGWQWSGNFYIEFPDDFVIRICNSHSHEESLVHITITLEENTLHIIFQDISHMPPYRIENLSMETLVFAQIDSDTTEKVLRPFEACGYAWDRPLYKKVLKVGIRCADAATTIPIGKFKFYKKEESHKIDLKPHGSHKSHPLYIEITNSGSTKVLSFRHEQKEEDSMKNDSNLASDDLNVTIKLEQIGISVINMTPEEILFASFTDLNCQFNRSSSESSCDLHLKSGQIDNQIYKAHHPVMISMIDKAHRLFSLEFKKRHSLVRTI